MSGSPTLINFDGQNLFKVMQGETFTVPDSVAVQSPTGYSSGVAPTTIFNTRRTAVGGLLFAAFSDAAGPALIDFTRNIAVGDVIACSAVAGGVTTVTVNGNTVLSITTTAIAGVLGYWA